MRLSILGLALVLAACAAPNYTPPAKFRLDIKSQIAPVQAVERTLGVRTLNAALPYKLKVVYRKSDYELATYENAEWAELPRDMVSRALTDALTATQRFKDVGDAADMALPDLAMTGELRVFDEVHTTDPWTAVCEMRLEVRDSQGPKALWAGTLRSSQPLEKNEVAALPAAMSKAVAEIAGKAAEQIAAAVSK